MRSGSVWHACPGAAVTDTNANTDTHAFTDTNASTDTHAITDTSANTDSNANTALGAEPRDQPWSNSQAPRLTDMQTAIGRLRGTAGVRRQALLLLLLRVLL